MNMTSSAGEPVNSPREMSLPFVSGNLKSGAIVPSGSMVDGVLAIRKLWEQRSGLSSAGFAANDYLKAANGLGSELRDEARDQGWRMSCENVDFGMNLSAPVCNAAWRYSIRLSPEAMIAAGLFLDL